MTSPNGGWFMIQQEVQISPGLLAPTHPLLSVHFESKLKAVIHSIPLNVTQVLEAEGEYGVYYPINETSLEGSTEIGQRYTGFKLCRVFGMGVVNVPYSIGISAERLEGLGYLQQVTYQYMYQNLIKKFEDHSKVDSPSNYDFSKAMIAQLHEILRQIEGKGMLHETIHCVTEKGYGKVGLVEKSYGGGGLASRVIESLRTISLQPAPGKFVYNTLTKQKPSEIGGLLVKLINYILVKICI